MDETTLARVRAVAASAATLAEQNETAREALLDASTRALQALCDAIPRTAIRAAGTRPAIHWRQWWLDSARTETETLRAPWRGIRLSGHAEPISEKTDQFAGIYSGYSLWVTDSGALHELAYEGTWSSWQGSASHWTATDRIVTAREASDEWDDLLPEAIEALSAALTRYCEGRAKTQADKTLAHAARLEALATLLAR